MPTIVDYDHALQRLTQKGLICNYHNSGAFGFARGEPIQIVGWVGPDDETIRDAMRPNVLRVPPPYDTTLARLTARVQTELLNDVAWAMPMSHWAYELVFGSESWMPALLERIGINAADLKTRNNGSALEFASGAPELEIFIQGLMQGLADSSDFMLAFADRPVLCMAHHHQQLWWMTRDESLAAELRAMVG